MKMFLLLTLMLFPGSTYAKDHCARNHCASDWVHKTRECPNDHSASCWNSDDNYKCCAPPPKKLCARNHCPSDWVHKTRECSKGGSVSCWNSDDNYKCCAPPPKKLCARNRCASDWVHKTRECSKGGSVSCWNSDDNFKCCAPANAEKFEFLQKGHQIALRSQLPAVAFFCGLVTLSMFGLGSFIAVRRIARNRQTWSMSEECADGDTDVVLENFEKQMLLAVE